MLKDKTINIYENEVKVLNLLNSLGIKESGKITSPEKKIWFKKIHYLQFSLLYNGSGYSWYYKYVAEDQKLEGKELKKISYPKLREILMSMNL